MRISSHIYKMSHERCHMYTYKMSQEFDIQFGIELTLDLDALLMIIPEIFLAARP